LIATTFCTSIPSRNFTPSITLASHWTYIPQIRAGISAEFPSGWRWV
jgi:hypothetical protein